MCIEVTTEGSITSHCYKQNRLEFQKISLNYCLLKKKRSRMGFISYQTPDFWFHCGLLSLQCKELVPALDHCSLHPPSGLSHCHPMGSSMRGDLLWAVPMGCRGMACSSMALSWAAGSLEFLLGWPGCLHVFLCIESRAKEQLTDSRIHFYCIFKQM